jgi:hypothetical protein
MLLLVEVEHRCRGHVTIFESRAGEMLMILSHVMPAADSRAVGNHGVSERYR